MNSFSSLLNKNFIIKLLKFTGNVVRLSGFLFMLAGIGGLLVTSLPQAFADPDVTPGCVPGVVFAGQFCIVKITGNAIQTRGDLTQVHDQEVDPDDDNTCANGLPNPSALVNVWIPVSDDASENPIRYWEPQSTSVYFPFNDGSGLIATSDTAAKLTSDGSDPSVSGVDSVAFKWKNLNFPLVKPKTDTRPAPSLLNILTCGKEGSQLQLNFQSRGFFETVLPVGGEILPINSAALLIAGISTSAMWILPTVGTIAGSGLALYKLRKSI